MVAAFAGFCIPFLELPVVLRNHVSDRLVGMVERGGAETEFEKALVELNPAPDRVANHFKWRVTQPVKIMLKVPKFALEMDLVRAAYTDAPHPLTNSDLSGMVLQLRSMADVPTLIDLVRKGGLEALEGILRTIINRVKISASDIRTVVLNHRKTSP